MTLLHQAAQKAVEAPIMKLADEAIHAYAGWLADFIAGDLPSPHTDRLNAEKDAAREKLRLAIASTLQQQPEPVAPNEWAAEAATVMAQFIHLSAQPERDAWAQNASRAIRLLNAPALQHQEEPRTAVIPPAPPECETEDEKTAFAFGYWQGLHAARKGQEVPREPGWWWCANCQCMVSPRSVTYEETHDARAGGCGHPVGTHPHDCAASPSTTRQQEVPSTGSAQTLRRLAEEAAEEAEREDEWFDRDLIESTEPILSSRKARRFIAAMTPHMAMRLLVLADRVGWQQEAGSGWRPIESAPREERVWFWVRPKTAEETWLDSSGNPIMSNGKPRLHEGKHGTWGSLETPVAWMPCAYPAAPSTPEKAGDEKVHYWCNKCGYGGPVQVGHQRPNGTGECGYMAASAYPAAPSPIPHPLPAQANDGGEHD